jgi:aminoglycoside phosphotransferase family enzyme/predicted kinase
MTSHERRLVAFLSDPGSYPHPAGAVERRETHVSHVFLAGGFAYKLKKPVKFPFLDASTLALRKRYCLLELTLNRRLAPATYLGIVPVTESRGKLSLGGRGRLVEWLVKMRRLPEARMMDQVVARRRITRRDIGRIAGRLVPFFRAAERGRSAAHYGLFPQVRELVLGNLRECGMFAGRLAAAADLATIERAYRQFLALYEPLLARRVRERRIIDGHGDLRCENICLTEPPAIFDCVEFQPAFRCGDMIYDLSFLVMDLEFRGRHDLGALLAARYRRALADRSPEALLAFYKCHRTLVRAKVRGFSWLQHPGTAEGRRIRRLAQRHFALALRYARQFAPPRLIAVGGLIGSGKSTLARGLADALGAAWLRTDEIRLTSFAHKRRAGQGFRGGLYAPHVSELVYGRLVRKAESLIRQGRSVVCDGTFSKAEGRDRLRRMARRHGASFHFVECAVPAAVALRRLARRAEAKSDISEARPAHYALLKRGFEPVRRWPRAAWSRLSDNRAPEATLRAALRALRRSWLETGRWR